MNLQNNLQENINSSQNTENTTTKPIFPPLNRPTNEQPLAQTSHKNFIDTPTHFETDYISMKWIPEKRRIDVIWKQFVSEDKVREVLLREVAMIRHTKVKCLFLDAQKFKGTNPNIPRWANEVWSQMVHDAGLKHFATVVSDKDIFAVFSLKYGMGEKLTSLVNCAVFKTIEEGEVWLRHHTHPEKPVYSKQELENIMEGYQNSTTNKVENRTVENRTENYILEEEITKNQGTETKLEDLDLKNEENINEFEENDKEEKNQIQIFSKFEDLEKHIQNIENKNSLNSDISENQS